MTDSSLHGEFLRHAVLDTVVPHASEIDIEEAISLSLEEDSEDSRFLLPGIKQRPLLFFGMSTAIRVP